MAAIHARDVLPIPADYLLTTCVLGHWFFGGNLKQLITVGKTSTMFGICFASLCPIAVPQLAVEGLLKSTYTPLKNKLDVKTKPEVALLLCGGYVLISLVCIRILQRFGDFIRVSKEVLGPLRVRRRIVVISLYGTISVGRVTEMANKG